MFTEETSRLVLYLTMPRSERGTGRTSRVITALRHKVASDRIRVVTSVEMWAEAETASKSHGNPPGHRKFWPVHDLYMARAETLLRDDCAGLVILCRPDGTVGYGITHELALAQRYGVPVRVVAPNGQLIALQDAGMVPRSHSGLEVTAWFRLWTGETVSK
jgi:hypothetical protein